MPASAIVPSPGWFWLTISAWFDSGPTLDRTLAAEGVCKAYGRVAVLYPVSFRLMSGQGLALLGPNGSGKTTLLRIVAGVTHPAAGGIGLVQDTDDGGQEPSFRVGFVGHDTYLYDDLTGYENLRFFTSLEGLKESDLRILEALDAVGMSSKGPLRVRAMSAGMKRRIALARVLLTQPDLLVLDEPSASLDPEGRNLVEDIVGAAKASGRWVIMASHDREWALSICESVLILEAGRVAFLGATAGLKSTSPTIWTVGE